MKSKTTKAFWKLLNNLPDEIQKQAWISYRAWREDVWNARFEFKQVHPSQPIYSVRINRSYRAVGVRSGDEVVWFWIGSHSDYDNLLNRL
jgi:hypothetical protein